jgi:hypothetical protein
MPIALSGERPLRSLSISGIPRLAAEQATNSSGLGGLEILPPRSGYRVRVGAEFEFRSLQRSILDHAPWRKTLVARRSISVIRFISSAR